MMRVGASTKNENSENAGSEQQLQPGIMRCRVMLCHAFGAKPMKFWYPWLAQQLTAERCRWVDS
eukprot:SAG31_NODE_11788_length_998_cov_1.570634_1_plen_63_part_10